LALVVCTLGSCLPESVAPGDAVSTPRSLDVVDPRPAELGLPDYPGVTSWPCSCRQVVGSTE
jgi:hypothetical protein